MKKTLFVLCFLFVSTFLFAQEKIDVKGKVTDANNDGLPGVSILVKGTSQGVITDLNGDFTINVASDATLVFSFIGYETQEATVSNQSVINITLAESTELVDEIVVVGYGEMKVKDLTSSVVTVKNDELVKSPSGQTMQALQGKVAGLQIVSTGNPGAEATVRIRGIGSYSSTSPPLYVVNGAFYNSIDFLNPSEIESISILKDASASAIYGVRAANGVVIITTKGGSFNSKSTITYDGYYGVQVPTNVVKMANSVQFVNYINQINQQTDPANQPIADMTYIDNAMQLWGRSRINPDVPNANTDWYKEIMHPSSPIQNHSLTVSGGSENTAYSVGISYFNQEGLLKMKNSYERINIVSKLDQKVNDWFKAGLNLNMSSAVRYLGETGAWFQAYHAIPILPTTDENNYQTVLNDPLNEFAYNASIYTSAQLAGYRGAQNPLITMNYNENRQDIKKVQTGVYGEISLMPSLKFKSTYNIYALFLKQRNFDFPYYITNDSHRDYSKLTSIRTLGVNQYLDNTLTYSKAFGDHDFTAMVGTSYRDELYNKLEASAEDLPDQENSWYIDQTGLEDSKEVNEEGERYYGFSYFGRIAYNYANKYLAYFTLRRDGSHKYQDKWGTFPAFGLGWVVSEESFFQGVNFIDYLKIRGGWGKLGTDVGERETGALSISNVTLAIDDNQINGTYSTSTFGYLGWEVVEGTNIGLTAELLDSRLNLNADYFIRDTENAIIPVSLKLQSGSINKNAGGIRNSGFELALNWNDKITDDLTYSIGVNLATLKNEVTDLYGQEYINAGSAEFRQRSEVGQPLFLFFGYETNGVYQNDTEITSDPIALDNGLVPGDLKFKDQNNDGILDDDDKVFLGTYFPNLTYGGSIGVNYKGLSFSMTFMGQRGNKILNRKRGEIIWTNDTNIDSQLANHLWNGEGTTNEYPSASGLRRGWNQNFSDYILEDGAFFRIQNIQLAYTLQESRFFNGMPETRIYFTAEKPYTHFKYNGFTPEVPDGIDRQYYPVPSVYTVGVNLKF